MSSRHPIRKRQQHCSEHPSVRKHYILPQLRLLAPKAKTPLLPPVQQRLQLERNKIWDVQDTETPTDAPASVKPQHLATSQSISFGHDFTSPQPLFPDSTVTSLEEKQHAVVTSSTDTYSSRMPLTSPDVGFPEFTPVNLLSGVVIHESHGISTHHLPYSSLQFQETIHNQYGGNYCTPRLNTPEVWTSMTKPTIDISQGQCSIHSIWFAQGGNEYILISIWLHRSIVPIHYRSTPPIIQPTITGHSTCTAYTIAAKLAARALCQLSLDLVFTPRKHHV